MPIVISVENLSKTYHLGQFGTGTFSRDLEVLWVKDNQPATNFTNCAKKAFVKFV